jgi:hypothetical protein
LIISTPLHALRQLQNGDFEAVAMNSPDAAMNSRPRNELPVPSVAVVWLTSAEVRFYRRPTGGLS